MKRTICAVLSAILLLSLAACGGGDKKAFELSKDAYENISAAYELIEDFGSDLYEAWRLGIYEDDEISVKFLAEELNLSEDELNAGIDALMGMEGVGDSSFSFYDDSLFSACVWLVSKAYEENGAAEEIQQRLSDAKDLMKTLSQDYSDYEHYPALKESYTTTNAFLIFARIPPVPLNRSRTRSTTIAMMPETASTTWITYLKIDRNKAGRAVQSVPALLRCGTSAHIPFRQAADFYGNRDCPYLFIRSSGHKMLRDPGWAY